MKYLHLFIALFCTTLILPFNSALAQDGEKEDDSAEGGDTDAGGGDAAPADGGEGGDTAAGGGDAAPAAGGEGGGDTAAGGGEAAPAAAPAAGAEGGDTAAGGGDAAPAPAPAAGGEGGGDAAAAPAPAPAPAAGGEAAPAPAPAPAPGGEAAAAPAPAPAAPAPAPAAPAPAPAAPAPAPQIAAPAPPPTVTPPPPAPPTVLPPPPPPVLPRVVDSLPEISTVRAQKAMGIESGLGKLLEQQDAGIDVLQQMFEVAPGETFDISKQRNTALGRLKKLDAFDPTTMTLDEVLNDNLQQSSEDLSFNADIDVAELKKAFKGKSISEMDDVLVDITVAVITGKSVEDAQAMDQTQRELFNNPELSRDDFEARFETAGQGDDPLAGLVGFLNAEKNGLIDFNDISSDPDFAFADDYFEDFVDPDVIAEFEGQDLFEHAKVTGGGKTEVALKAANGKAIVLKSGEKYIFSNNLDNTPVYTVSLEDGEIPYIAVYTAISPTTMKEEGTFREDLHSFKIENGLAVFSENDGDVEYIKPFFDGQNFRAISLEFDAGTTPDQQKIDKFASATSIADLVNLGIVYDQQDLLNNKELLFGDLPSAESSITGLEQSLASTVLSDSSGKPMMLKFDDRYAFPADMSGVTLRLVMQEGPDSKPFQQNMVFSGGSVSGVDEYGAWSAPYTVQGGIIRVTEQQDDGTYVSFHKPFYDPAVDKFFTISLNFGPGEPNGNTVNLDLVDALYFARSASSLPSSIFSGLDKNKEFIYPAESGADSALITAMVNNAQGIDTLNAATVSQITQATLNAYNTNNYSLTALEGSVVLITSMLQDINLNNPSGVDIESINHFNAARLNPNNQYNRAVIEMLIDLHAIGDSRNSERVGNMLQGLLNKPSFQNGQFTGDTTGMADLLDHLLGTRGYFDPSSNNRDEDFHNNEVRRVPLDNIDVITGKDIVISTNNLTDSVDEHPDATDITILASGRDLTITQSLQINPQSTAHEDVYVLASADELYLRDSYENWANAYTNPSRMSLNVSSASLALAAMDSMHLVNVDISTGGGLGLASLDEINIWSTDGARNTFNLKNDLYVYADNAVKINDLDITGQLSNVYMESKTINLTNVNFPAHSSVLLSSRDGTMGFYGSPGYGETGRVNFRDVKHLGYDPNNVLNSGNFNPTPTGHVLNRKHADGREFLEVRKHK